MPGLDPSREGQRGQNQGQDHHCGLGEKDQVPFGNPIGHDPCPQGDQKDGHRRGEADQAEVEGGAGQNVNQP
jgi:hypothetical protein